MSKFPKLTPEQLKQLENVISMQKGAGATVAKRKDVKTILRIGFVNFLKMLQNSVKFIDQFINFVTKQGSNTTNIVIENARNPILFGTYVIVIFVIFGLGWACFAPLDSAAVAIGTLISDTKKKTINHQEGGILEAVYVKVGDEVKKGQKLLEFDDTRIKAEYESTLHQYRTFLASENRLFAEINEDSDVKYSNFLTDNENDANVKKIITTQNNLFKARVDRKRTEKVLLEQKMKQYTKEIDGFLAKKEALTKSLEVIRENLKAKKELKSRGYVQKLHVSEIEEREAHSISDLAVNDTNIIRVQQEITKTEIELLNLESKFTTEVLSELRDVQSNLSQYRERFFALENSLERTTVISPVDGIVNQIYYTTIDSYVPPSQTILEISPTDDNLIIEAKIAPQNIDSVRVGLVSKIRFSAFKSRTTPLFLGKVVALSPDLVPWDPRVPMTDPKLSQGYYLVQIELDQDKVEEITRTRKVKLVAGMQAEVQIVTGTRTLMKYLLDPVFDSMFKGLKEK